MLVDDSRAIETKADLTFRRERLSDIWMEVGPLMLQHDAEIWPPERKAEYGGSWGKLEPDIQRCFQLENPEAQALFIVTARNAEGELVGYTSDIIARGLHFKNSIESVCDTVYLRPDYRRGHSLSIRSHPGFQLLKAREQLLDDHGAERRRITTKLWIEFGALLALLGYKPEATVHLKVVPRKDGD